MADELEPRVFESPLASWPGSFTLPHTDEFSGAHWQTHRKAVDKPLRASYSMIHLYAYAGLEVIKAYGEWNMETSLKEVQAWETDPEAERIKFIAWIGRTYKEYMLDIMDPKD